MEPQHGDHISSHSSRPQGAHRALAVGIDRFSRIRAAIGYETAEALIAVLSRQVLSAFPDAALSRLAPDAIGVVIVDSRSAEAIADRLHQLRTTLEKSMDVGSRRIHVGIRIGYACDSVENATSPSDLLVKAELALDQARQEARRLQKFSEESYGDPARRLALLDDLQTGLRNGEVSLRYQPIVRTRTGDVASVESLMRWTSPVHGVVPPSQFIPTAEETGQIHDLTLFAIRQGLKDAEILQKSGFPMRVAVNISSRLLTDRGFVDSAMELLDSRFERITFEITETSAIDDWRLALKHLRLFSAVGVKLAIDDYGSGLSSLAYLQQLPAHVLKIDKAFITQLTSSHKDPLLVRSTIELGHALELEVVGEGVETPETLALLTMMGCDLVQGYLLGKPMTLTELLAYLKDGAAKHTISAPIAPRALFGL